MSFDKKIIHNLRKVIYECGVYVLQLRDSVWVGFAMVFVRGNTTLLVNKNTVRNYNFLIDKIQLPMLYNFGLLL